MKILRHRSELGELTRLSPLLYVLNAGGRPLSFKEIYDGADGGYSNPGILSGHLARAEELKFIENIDVSSSSRGKYMLTPEGKEVIPHLTALDDIVDKMKKTAQEPSEDSASRHC
jgi:DNA-binding HxlR family transcriptional regulator